MGDVAAQGGAPLNAARAPRAYRSRPDTSPPYPRGPTRLARDRVPGVRAVACVRGVHSLHTKSTAHSHRSTLHTPQRRGRPSGSADEICKFYVPPHQNHIPGGFPFPRGCTCRLSWRLADHLTRAVTALSSDTDSTLDWPSRPVRERDAWAGGGRGPAPHCAGDFVNYSVCPCRKVTPGF